MLSAVCLPADLTFERDVTACREAGLDRYVWVVDDPETARCLTDRGGAGVVTDCPEVVRPAVEPTGERVAPEGAQVGQAAAWVPSGTAGRAQ